MYRKYYKWTGACRLQIWNAEIEKPRFDVVEGMMPVDLIEWFRDLEGKAILLIEGGHMILDQNNSERGFVIWWLREIARMTKSEGKLTIVGHPDSDLIKAITMGM